MDSNNTQHVRLSDQIPNLNSSLIVVCGSRNSNFNAGLVIINNFKSLDILIERDSQELQTKKMS